MVRSIVLLLVCFVAEDPAIPEAKTDPTYNGVSASAYVKLLFDRNPEAAMSAARALYEIGDECIPHVEPYMRKGNLESRDLAFRPVHLLLKFKQSKEAIKCYERCLDCVSNKDAQVAALIGIARLEESAGPVIKKVEALAADKESKVQDVAKKVVERYNKLKKGS